MSDSSGYCPRCNRTGKERQDDQRDGNHIHIHCLTCEPRKASK